MEKELLLAVDGSERSVQAASIVGNLLKDHPDCQLLLFYSMEQPTTLYPGELVADPHNPYRFSSNQLEKVGNSVLEAASRALLDSGFPRNRIALRLKANGSGPADDVLAQAETDKIGTIVCGRRGRTLMDNLLLGSVSSKIAQYSKNRTVWIVDTPVHQTRKVLIAMEGAPDSRALTYYAAEFLAPIPQLQFTIFHIMPALPPSYWDDGHILGNEEQEIRRKGIERWRSDSTQRVEKFVSEAQAALQSRGVSRERITVAVKQMQEGVARDLLKEIALNQYHMVVIGKRSFHEKKPFLMGSHANKILQSIKGAILCLVDS